MEALTISLLLCVLYPSEAFLFSFGSDKWDALKVTWDINPLNSNAFASLPRTVGEATNAGFKKISSCGDSKPFAGNRYMKGQDTSVMLLYDSHGYIAGIQVGIPKGLPRHYPSAMVRPPWVEDGNQYILTAYFVNPSTICSTGRTPAQYASQGTGTGLYIQNGTSLTQHILKIPDTESGMANTMWTKGKCFKTMGVHYWYNLRENMNCDEFQPFFILYNKGKLNAFGWAMNADLTSNRYEHPPLESIGMFMQTPPSCLKEQGRLTTMHIYLSGSPRLDDWC